MRRSARPPLWRRLLRRLAGRNPDPLAHVRWQGPVRPVRDEPDRPGRR